MPGTLRSVAGAPLRRVSGRGYPANTPDSRGDFQLACYFYQAYHRLEKITGSITEMSVYASAAEAEAAFYRAFENADVAAMMAVWEPTDDIECIHPLGERITGLHAVDESWRRILSRSGRMQFELGDIKHFGDDRLVTHILYENITIDGNRQPAVIATNIYRYNGTGWLMILHHASPATAIGTGKSPNGSAGDTQTLH
jgi:ketosteroid isomerase-like protein